MSKHESGCVLKCSELDCRVGGSIATEKRHLNSVARDSVKLLYSKVLVEFPLPNLAFGLGLFLYHGMAGCGCIGAGY